MIKKYKMWILVVFGILIMISFLMADWLQRGINFANESRRVYTLDGHKVSAADYQQAAAKVEGVRRATGQFLDQHFGPDLDPAQWQLLAESVRRAGLYGGPGDGQAFATALTTQRFIQEFGTQNLGYQDWQDNAKTKLGMTTEQLNNHIERLAASMMGGMGRGTHQNDAGPEAFAELRGYNRLEDAYGNIAHLSEARLAAKVREMLDQAKIQYLWVPVTDSLASSMPTPTPEELTAHFNKYKDIEVGAGEYGMGLRQPDRVAYSYFYLPRGMIEDQVHVDPIDVRKRLMKEYPGQEADPGHRAEVEAKLKGEQVERVRAALEIGIRAEILKLTASIPEKAGYKELPTDPAARKKIADLLGMAGRAMQRVNDELKLGFTGAAVTGPTKLQSRRELSKEPAVGEAVVQHGRGMIPVSDLLFESKEFGKPVGAIPVQVGVPIGEPFHGPAHNPPRPEDGAIFFFVLNEVKPAASPASLDEVRAQVEADVKKLKAIEAARKLVTERVPVATELGFGQVADQLKAAGFTDAAVKTALVSRRGIDPYDATIAQVDFVKEVLAKAGAIDPALKLEKTSAPERTWVTTIPGKAGAVLVQITEFKPVTAEDFQAIAGYFKNQAEVREILEADKDFSAFRQETLIKRLHVEGLEKKKKE